jgi:hypothetical protein
LVIIGGAIMKKCPYCAEAIQDEAVKCRFCGEHLISAEMRELASRWGTTSQAERDRRWTGLAEQQQRELTLALQGRSPAPPVAASPAPTPPREAKSSALTWGCLIFIALFVVAAIIFSTSNPGSRTRQPRFSVREPSTREPTRASESVYNRDVRKATTSRGLTNADIAWHAVNTYGWDCNEVVSRQPQSGEFYVVTCSNGTQLRVYPRSDAHPRITNMQGEYE